MSCSLGHLSIAIGRRLLPISVSVRSLTCWRDEYGPTAARWLLKRKRDVRELGLVPSPALSFTVALLLPFAGFLFSLVRASLLRFPCGLFDFDLRRESLNAAMESLDLLPESDNPRIDRRFLFAARTAAALGAARPGVLAATISLRPPMAEALAM